MISESPNTFCSWLDWSKVLDSGTPGEPETDGAESRAGGRVARSAIASRTGASGGATINFFSFLFKKPP